ncbi:hypothetical protein J4477_04145 [Candidatus Pacearchaeota archaeon]|nr:hypothetical protein [Candidatus Pacearchaeota archaeon]
MEVYWLWPGIAFIAALIVFDKALSISSGISLFISVLIGIIVGLIIYRREN